MKTKVLFSLLSLLVLARCSSDDLTMVEDNESEEPGIVIRPAPEGEPRVRVNIVDGEGQPFRPDRVLWYYTTDDSGPAVKYKARCVNDGCTQWVVTGATDGRIYVAGSYSREQSAHCNYVRSAAMPVDVETGVVPEVTLRLEALIACE